jgi:hypothetical protein
MELKELLAGLAEHKDAPEVKSLFNQAITVDQVKSFLLTPDGEKLIRSGTIPAADKRADDILKKYQEKAQAELDIERKGKMTLEEQVQQISKKLEDAQKAQELADKRARVAKLASEKKVPQDFIDILDLNKPDEQINLFIEAEAKRQEALIKQGTDQARSVSVKPGSGSAPNSGPDVSKMTSQERLAYEIKRREERSVTV